MLPIQGLEDTGTKIEHKTTVTSKLNTKNITITAQHLKLRLDCFTSSSDSK